MPVSTYTTGNAGVREGGHSAIGFFGVCQISMTLVAIRPPSTPSRTSPSKPKSDEVEGMITLPTTVTLSAVGIQIPYFTTVHFLN